MRRQTLFLLFMILFSLPLTVLAQGTKTVKGTVVDQNNEPIIGATVVVKGSTIGAATDLRFCALLRLNLSTKDIAQMTNLTIRGVEAARYRLRKKLDIPDGTGLVDFLIDLK